LCDAVSKAESRLEAAAQLSPTHTHSLAETVLVALHSHRTFTTDTGRFTKFSMPLSEPSILVRREHAACQRYASAPAVHKALKRSADPAGALVSLLILASEALSSNSTCLVAASYKRSQTLGLCLHYASTGLAYRCASAEDAVCMARALDSIMTRSSSQAVCCLHFL